MVWLVIAALGVWIWVLSRGIEALRREVDDLKRALEAALNEGPEDEADEDDLLLSTPLPRGARDTLILDTPLPPPSNDVGEIEEEFEPEEEELEPAPAASELLEDDDLVLAPLHEAPHPEARQRAPRISLEKWLLETALPWLGAAAAVWAVAMLVQLPVFTPIMRVVAGIVIGVLLIAVGEWVRRGGVRVPVIRHPLAAAVLAGAGVTAFYMAVLAAQGYDLVDRTTAAALLAACALLLVALSTAHGQALGVLAVLAALIAPPLTQAPTWPDDALTLYVVAVAITGFTLAGLRRWIWVAGATIAGLYVWFAAAIAGGDIVRGMILLAIASIGGTLLGFQRPNRSDPSWDDAIPHLPAIAIPIGSVLMLWTWLEVVTAPNPALPGAMLAALLHVGLAAGAVRARVTHPAAFVVAVAGLLLGAVLFSAVRERFGTMGDFYSWTLAGSTLVGLAALWARPDRHGRALTAGAGAAGTSLLIILAAFSREEWTSPAVWAPLLATAALMGLAAQITARDAIKPKRDWAVDAWAAGSCVLLLIGAHSLAPERVLPTIIAATALAMALGLRSRGWRALGWGALVAATLTLAHALSGDFMGRALVGATPITETLAVLLSSAGFLFAAARAGAPRARDKSEALNAAALILVLMAAFHALRWFAAGGAGMTLSAFTEAALDALTLVVAGFLVLPRGERELGVIGQLRGHVLMGAGLLFAFLQFGIIANPWWGERAAAPLGPALLNAQALAFAAPAALAFAAAATLYKRQLLAGRAYAVTGGVFTALWVVAEIRRGFHGPLSHSAEVGVFEGHCYALAALAGSLLIAFAARARDAKDKTRPFTHDLSRASRVTAVVGVIIAALLMLFFRHPWWGAQDGFVSTELSGSLSILAQAVAVVLAVFLGRALSRGDGVERSRFVAASAAAVFGWSFGHAAIRWLHHRAAMDESIPLRGLESFGHALWPLVFVLGASALTARAPGRDTVRAYLYDLEAIWGAAIWPALVWGALGLWFFFNPWWGLAPASAMSPLAAGIGLFALGLAAWFSAYAPDIPRIRFRHWFEMAARVACVGHLFVALSLILRWLYQGGEMRAALEAGSLETWTYSAAWALFGAGVLGVGFMRKDATLRWCGIAVLLFTTGKVFVFDTARLDGVVRVGSLLALAAVLFLSTLATRRFNRTPQG